MTLNLFFHALLMLSAIGTAVCAAETRRARDLCLFAATFSGALWWFTPQRPPDPAWIGFLAAAAAAHRLAWPRKTWPLAATGGLLAGVAATLIAFEGAPLLLAGVAVVTLAGLSRHLAMTRPLFAPAVLLEEAAIALLVIALAVAIAPGVVTGWHAAQALNLPDRNASAPIVPSWVIAIGGGAVLLGGAHRLWRR